MKFKGYNFPHPILLIDSFNPIVAPLNSGINISSPILDLEILNIETKELLQSNRAEIICEIQCSDTFFRKIEFSHSDMSFNFTIDNSLFRNKIDFDFLIVVKNEINDFFIGKRKYFLESGDVIASLGKCTYGGGNGTISSLIKFNENLDNNEVRYDLENHHITIGIPTIEFEKIRRLKNNSNFGKIFISSIFQPALFYVCSFLEDETYDDKEWSEFLKSKWQATGEDSEFPEKKLIPKFVQLLLQNPLELFVKTLERIENIGTTED